MKIRVLAAAGLAFALSLGAFAAVAGADTFPSIDLRPYGTGTVGVGFTSPGQPDSDLCLILAHDYDAGTTGVQPLYQGKVNGTTVPTRTGELDVDFFDVDAFATASTCVPTAMTLAANDAANVAVPSAAAAGGGTLRVSTISSLPAGVLAPTFTTVRVNYSAGQYVKVPAGATIVGGDLGVAGGPAGFVDLSLKPFVSTSKSVLNPAACSDHREVIDTNTHDGSKSNAPTASDLGSAGAPSASASGVYVATLRKCAQSTTPNALTAVTSSISVVGHGAVNVQFLKSDTVNIQLWDTTRGATCSAAKLPGTFGSTGLDSSRVLQCKGDWGDPIGFSMDVRNWIDSGSGFKDGFGLLHPGAPVTMLSATF